MVGTTLRLFDPKTGRWSIWWAGKSNPVLDSPVVGAFDGDRGIFEAEDVFEGRPILVRFIWSRVTTRAPRWEQAFSEDGGHTWETNWVMDYTRMADGEAQSDVGPPVGVAGATRPDPTEAARQRSDASHFPQTATALRRA